MFCIKLNIIDSIRTVVVCSLLFYVYVISSTYAKDISCLAKQGDKIIYNTGDNDNTCSILYNIGDNSNGIGIVNKVADDLTERITGKPCAFDSKTDSNISNVGTVATSVNILNGSSINLSCSTGYELNNVNSKTIYCNDGVLSYDFAGCKFTGNRGTDLKTYLVEYLNKNNYSLNDLALTASQQDSIFSFDTLYALNSPVTINCKSKQGYAFTNGTIVIKPLGYERWEAMGEVCKYAQQCLTVDTADMISRTSLSYYSNVSNSINDCSIDWGDGNITSCSSNINNHSYSEKAKYSIKICGNNLETGSVKNIDKDDIFAGELVSSGTGDSGKFNSGYAIYGAKEGTVWFVMLENSI